MKDIIAKGEKLAMEAKAPEFLAKVGFLVFFSVHGIFMDSYWTPFSLPTLAETDRNEGSLDQNLQRSQGSSQGPQGKELNYLQCTEPNQTEVIFLNKLFFIRRFS